MIHEILAKLEKTSSWFDIYQSDSRTTPIEFKNNRLHMIKERQNSGTGIRLNRNGRTGFSYTNNTDELGDTASRAAELSAFGETENFELPGPDLSYPQLEVKTGASIDLDVEIEKGQVLIDTVRNEFPDVDVDLSVSGGSGSRRIINSNGVDLSDSSSFYSASLSLTRVDQTGSRVETWESLTAPHPVSIDALTDRVLENLRRASQSDHMKSGRVPVFLTHKAFASLLDILLSGLSAKALYKHVSPYEGSFGKKLFTDEFTLYDNPLVPDSIYSYSFDDEGIPAEKRAIFEKGTVAGFISDIKYASLLNSKPSGNASRGYTTLPHSSFSNIDVSPGSVSSDEITAAVQDGIIVDQFMGLGQSNTFTGDFSANLDLAFRIRGGRITGRVKDCMISDNVFKLFRENLVFSSDRKRVGKALLPAVLMEDVNFSS
ncbi:MAG: TldD/PmbA family protein [Spirochaetota bacterium]